MKQVETDLNDLTLIGEEEIIVKWDGKEVSNDETVMRSDAGVRSRAFHHVSVSLYRLGAPPRSPRIGVAT